MFDLITGVILLIIGIVLFAVSRALPPVANTIAYWLGILLAVVGVIVIVVWLLTGAIGGPGPYYWDIDSLVYQSKILALH
jgi:hypothetical protein